MANFARGLQAGLPVGLALGEGIRDRRERRAYQEAAQQWVPEESDINLGDASISGGASPMARGIGPQMSPEDMQAVEAQRLAAPPGTMQRSQTQRRFTLPGAPGEMYGTEAEASQAARVRGLEAQRQAAMQLGDIDAANRLASSIHSMEQDEQRTALAVRQDEREQAAAAMRQTEFDQRQQDQAELREFNEATAGMSVEARLRAAGDVSNPFVRNSVIDEVASELGITSAQAQIRLANMEIGELNRTIRQNTEWEDFFSENAYLLDDAPQSFLDAARASRNPDFVSRANDIVRDDVSTVAVQQQAELGYINLAHQRKLLEEDKNEWAEIDRINEKYSDPNENLQARLDSPVLAVRMAALAEAKATGQLEALDINIAATQLEFEAMQQVAAVNRAHEAYMRAGATDVNVFFDSLNMGGEPVQVVPAQDAAGRDYLTLGRDTNGDGEVDNFLNFRGTSLDDLYRDVLTKFSSPEALLNQKTNDNRNSVASFSNSDLRQMAQASSDSLQTELMVALHGPQYSVMPSERQEAMLQEAIDSIRLTDVTNLVMDDMIEGVETGQWNSRVTNSSVADWIKSDRNLVYDPEEDAFYIRSPTDPTGRLIPAEIFRPGSEAREQAIDLWQQAERERREAFSAAAEQYFGPGGSLGPAAEREARLQSEPERQLSRGPSGFAGPPEPVGGLVGVIRGRIRESIDSYDKDRQGRRKSRQQQPGDSQEEQDMADGGLVKASGESARGNWRERAAAGIRANQQAQRSMEGEIAPSAPLAYQPLNDMSPTERMQRSRVPAPRNMADGGIARKDMRGGGEVSGPGTGTSDSIPARLSDGEYVLNAETVKMVGEDYLDKINNAGLRRRDSRKRR